VDKKLKVTAGVFLLLLFFAAKAYGNGGVILQPVQTPAPEQTYARLETVELLLTYNPDHTRHHEVKVVIDGNEIELSLKNVIFCEIWQMPAEVWTANISLPLGEHTCQYFYVESVKQSSGFWADFHVQTTKPFKFYVVGEEQSTSILGEPQTQVEDTAKNENLAETSTTLGLDIKTVGFYLLLAAGVGAYIVKTHCKLANCIKHK
jgi:hypothetical protein